MEWKPLVELLVEPTDVQLRCLDISLPHLQAKLGLKWGVQGSAGAKLG